MRKKEETKERNQTLHTEQRETRKSKPIHLRKAILRKVIPYILVGCITSSAVMMSYNEAEEVKAEAISITALTVCALLAVMATMGITYATQNILETWEDGNNALDPDYEDIFNDWSYNYDTELQLLLEQQGSSGSGNNDDLPPDFKSLMTQISLAGTTASITTDVWNLLKKSGKNLFQKSYELGTLFADATIPDGMNVPINYIDSSTLAILHSNKYLDALRICKDAIIYGSGPVCFLKDANVFGYIYIYGKNAIDKDLFFKEGELYQSSVNGFYGGVGTLYENSNVCMNIKYIPYYDTHISKYPTFSTRDKCIEYMLQFAEEYKPNRQDEPIWVTPELQDTYENKGQFDFPENVPNPLRVPNIGDLQELARKLNPESNPNYNPEEVPEYIKQYINDLKVDPSPDPNPDPNPNPDPDNPNNPNNPDNPTNNNTFLADLKHLFPFCIPFDLVDCFKLFNAEPVTPRVEFPVHFGIINYDHTFVIDLKDFDKVAVVCRSTFLIIYMTGLILATRALIKG